MNIAELQEKNFIQRILGPLASTAKAEKFEDAVVIDLVDITGYPDAPYLVYSLDQPYFIHHADTSLDPYRFYGRWIAGTTCNDVIAMGGRCRGFSLALAAPPETDTAHVEAIGHGINDVLRHMGAVYEGGNFHNGDLATVGCAWGTVPRHGIVRRSGARVGDRIVVTGELGLGWLEYLLRRHDLTDLIDDKDKRKFRTYKSMPVGAASAVTAVAERGQFTSGMDLSDGLVEFLYTVGTRNDAGCTISADKLPVSLAVRRNSALLGRVDPDLKQLGAYPFLLALDPGYDSPMRHAFTVRPGHVAQAQAEFAAHGAELHVIGEVTATPGIRLRTERAVFDIPPFWDDNLRQNTALSAWAQFIKDLDVKG
ncbi:AIR synthase related protein [Streptomyces sp. NPDC046759]|uniref:thiamine-phosphate kinase n=1 Tax=Streptomyces sp. NPDC046759 TaxID=3155019 RepID=UPI0033DF8F02